MNGAWIQSACAFDLEEMGDYSVLMSDFKSCQHLVAVVPPVPSTRCRWTHGLPALWLAGGTWPCSTSGTDEALIM